MKKMFARMLALAMTCVVLLTGCGQNPSSSVSGSGGNGSGVQSSGDWPKQPVNVICPASAGGGTDLILRTINEYFTRMTGQPFVVNNITGLTGYEMIHQGTTDGYDFIMGTTTIFTSELDGTLDYDWNDYEMVAFIEGDFNTVIAIPPIRRSTIFWMQPKTIRPVSPAGLRSLVSPICSLRLWLMQWVSTSTMWIAVQQLRGILRCLVGRLTSSLLTCFLLRHMWILVISGLSPLMETRGLNWLPMCPPSKSRAWISLLRHSPW